MRRSPLTTLIGLASLVGLLAAAPGCKPAQSAEVESNTAEAKVAASGAKGAKDDQGFPAGPYADRDPKLAKQLVDQGALLLDVRTPGEFAAGHVEGAVNITHTEVADRLDEIRELQGGDAHKPIVVYCRSGRRSGIAKQDLEEAGFDRVTNLGGLSDWCEDC